MNRQRQLMGALAALTLAGSAWAQEVQPTTRLNPLGDNLGGDTNNSNGLAVAQRGSTFVSVWAEEGGLGEGTQDIWASVSLDAGNTWGAETRVDLGDGAFGSDSEEPAVVICDDGAIVVIWEDKRDSGSPEDLFYNRSTDNGVTWMPVALPLNTPTSGTHVTSDIDRPAIAADGTRVVVTWEEDSLTGIGGAEEVWFTQSQDCGATWSAPVVINGGAPLFSDSDDPKVSVSGMNINVALVDDASGSDENCILHSGDGGATFSRVAIETDPSGDSDGPVLCQRGDLVLVVFEDNEPGGGADSAHAVVSTDGGATWGPETDISVITEATVNAEVLWATCGVSDNGTDLYVTYSSDHVDILAGGSGGQAASDVYVAVSTDAGATWTTDVLLDTPARPSNRPAVRAEGDTAVVYYESFANGANGGAFVFSEDRGATWSAPLDVLDAGGQVAADLDTDDLHGGTWFQFDPTGSSADAAGVAIAVAWDNNLGHNEPYALRIDLGAIPTGIQSYCTSKINSLGCVPAIGWSGVPSASGAGVFQLTAATVLNNKPGILFYGVNGRAAIPFQGGFLCTAPPIKRTPVQVSGGNPPPNDCSGTFAFDMNAWIGGGQDPALIQGTVVNAQYWSRDPQSPSTTSLTDAVEFVVGS